MTTDCISETKFVKINISTPILISTGIVAINSRWGGQLWQIIIHSHLCLCMSNFTEIGGVLCESYNTKQVAMYLYDQQYRYIYIYI